jgi:hypothetical protein
MSNQRLKRTPILLLSYLIHFGSVFRQFIVGVLQQNHQLDSRFT